jgi:hypothetical protein
MNAYIAGTRVLALHITTGGLAFALFESAGRLLDWGIKHVKKGNKNQESLRLVEQLVVKYDPHSIVIEDTSDHSSKRVKRVRDLYRLIEQLADRVKVEVFSYPWPYVFSVFKEYGVKTRHDLALVLAPILPQIKRRLPPKRKIWLPQDPRQALFDAAALGYTHYKTAG